MSDIHRLTEAMRQFSEERDWARFHDPKSLTLALMGEVGELAELLQWLPAADLDARTREPTLNARLGEEMADVLLYLLRLADVAGVDFSEATATKLQANIARFSVAEHHGRGPSRE
ncbi:nucleotide pyrophosphohydrolase [Blastococcus sp. HT6-30]|uniref:nucleotide pyrophosphohydrolase n=1 Tax=Blastococcus sp. HT6-30 TaxID=3144843 RepID=UPI00321B1535